MKVPIDVSERQRRQRRRTPFRSSGFAPANTRRLRLPKSVTKGRACACSDLGENDPGAEVAMAADAAVAVR